MQEDKEKFLGQYPKLKDIFNSIDETVNILTKLFISEGTLYLAGNGGSAADCEHICGEFLKGFLQKRPMNNEDATNFSQFGNDGQLLQNSLQYGVRAISLLSHPGLLSAFANDVNPNMGFAQQIWALGKKGDVFLGISTGGNALNIRYALQTAKAKGLKTILLTGNKHGECEKYSDVNICVPESETYKIQELHLPVYHALCAMLEEEFFD
jgi:D-sedoheptulose 7-phosphate isomerase